MKSVSRKNCKFGGEERLKFIRLVAGYFLCVKCKLKSAEKDISEPESDVDCLRFVEILETN